MEVVIVMYFTEEELANLYTVVDDDPYDLLDGHQHLADENPELWNKKYYAMTTLKTKIEKAYESMKKKKETGTNK